MIFTTIRTRMLAAALLPVTLVIVVLVGVFWSTRVGDLDAAHRQRAKLLVHQVAIASEYGLFSGNLTNLQSVVNGMQREPDVRSVAVFGAGGLLLARAGAGGYQTLADLSSPVYVQQQRARGIDVLTEVISTSDVQLDDLFSPPPGGQPVPPMVLGHAVVELSTDGLRSHQRDILFVAVFVGFVGWMVGGGLATRLGQGVVLPVARVSRMIERIGRGDLAVGADPDPKDPLYELQMGLGRMAERLAWSREDLEQRVATVTHELRLKKEEAEAATLAKSRFLAAASHDLRQPTHALGMFIARLGQLPMDAQTRQLVGSLEASVHAMQDLLDGLLDLSRLDAGAVPVHVRAVPMDALLESVRSVLGPVAADKGLRLRVRPTALWAMTDEMLLQRMVMNLVQNAIRYTERGTVLLACRPADHGNGVRIEVWDSGIGVSPEHQSEIFKEFYQVGNTGRERSRGLGLGLNIVERSARLLGHTVVLRSNLGCGTRFSITAPRAVAPAAMPVVVASALPSVAGLDGVRVLVIEDDGSAREAIRELLASWGCHVEAAQTLEQARVLLRNGAIPDVIVSDFRLGDGSNGLSAIASLRDLAGHDIPACLMSGDTDGALMQAAKAAGLTLLHKPVRPAKLRSLLRHLTSAAAGGQRTVAPDDGGQDAV